MSTPNDATQVARKTVDAVRIALGLSGLVAIIIGVIFLLNPGDAAVALMSIIAVIFGALAALVGIVYISVGLFSKTLTGGKRFLRALVGVIYIAAAIVIFANLATTSKVLISIFTIIVGIVWIIEGAMAFALLGEARSKVFVVIYALLSIVAGAFLVFSPLTGAAVATWFLGLALVIIGLVQVVRAFTAKPEVDIIIG